MMRATMMVMGVLALAGLAQAGEPLQFVAPAKKPRTNASSGSGIAFGILSPTIVAGGCVRSSLA